MNLSPPEGQMLQDTLHPKSFASGVDPKPVDIYAALSRSTNALKSAIAWFDTSKGQVLFAKDVYHIRYELLPMIPKDTGSRRNCGFNEGLRIEALISRQVTLQEFPLLATGMNNSIQTTKDLLYKIVNPIPLPSVVLWLLFLGLSR